MARKEPVGAVYVRLYEQQDRDNLSLVGRTRRQSDAETVRQLVEEEAARVRLDSAKVDKRRR